MKIPVEFIRVDGTRETVDLEQETVFTAIEESIKAPALDHVNLRDGRMMWVDDMGAISRPLKPVNDTATKMYHMVCVAGTTWPIRGDVAITRDSDWGDD